jgi:hypothetical protein
MSETIKLDIAKPVRAPLKPSFWARQFDRKPTVEQSLFDVIFGVLAPIGCLLFDPVVFRGGLFGSPLLSRWLTAGWCAIGLGIVSLAVWLYRRRPAALLAGVLLAGSLFALLLGIVMLPLSLIGLIMVIGIFGFMPFVTAFVFWRNFIRAVRSDAMKSRRATPMVLFVVGLATGLLLPLAANGFVTSRVARGTEMILFGDAAQRTEGVVLLRTVRFAADLDALVWAYDRATNDEAARRRIADAYREITGDDIERRHAILLD